MVASHTPAKKNVRRTAAPDNTSTTLTIVFTTLCVVFAMIAFYHYF